MLKSAFRVLNWKPKKEIYENILQVHFSKECILNDIYLDFFQKKKLIVIFIHWSGLWGAAEMSGK